MLIAKTSFSASILLFLALIAFAAWPNIYKRTQSRWRFELFSLDFALGSFFFALLAAYTIGTFGPELTFADRLLVAGRASTIWLAGAGVVFALAHTLFLPAISLLGLSAACAIAFGTSGVMLAVIRLRPPHLLEAAIALALFLLCILCGTLAAQGGVPLKRGSRTFRGILLAALGGVAFGALQPLLGYTADPEFGPGAYATILLFSVGTLLAVPALNFFFMHIKILGNPINLRTYAAGARDRHLPGVAAGVLWSGGFLCLLLAVSAPSASALVYGLSFLFPAFSVVACLLLGLFLWKEYATGTTRSRLLLVASAVWFVAGIAMLGYGFEA